MDLIQNILNTIPPQIQIALFTIVSVLVLIYLFMILKYGSLWLQARISGAPVTLVELIGMSIRKVKPRTIVVARIMACKAGLDLSIARLESHYLAGGRVPNVVRALIAADRAEVPLDWNAATALDLAGEDILELVQQRSEKLNIYAQ